MTQSPSPAASRPRPAHLWQIDLARIAPMAGMAATHVVIYTAPPAAIATGASLMVLHVSREMFLFISAFVIFYSTGAYERGASPIPFWRRRVHWIVVPYVLWTLIYWPLSGGTQSSLHDALAQLGTNLSTGWFHLYFLLLTLQLYAIFPALAWLLRATRGRDLAVLGAAFVVQAACTEVMQYHWYAIPSSLGIWMDNAQMELTSYPLYVVAGALAAVHHRRLLELLRAHRRGALCLVALAFVAGEGCYGINLALGQPPITASNVFQPGVIPLVLACLLGSWMLAERWLGSHALDGRLWRGLRGAADGSFGFYLVHMVPLLVITQQPVLSLLPTDRLPSALGTVVRLAIVIGAGSAFVWVVRRTPFSRPLTGRVGARSARRAAA